MKDVECPLPKLKPVCRVAHTAGFREATNPVHQSFKSSWTFYPVRVALDFLVVAPAQVNLSFNGAVPRCFDQDL